jgi:hypothetical protein
MEERMKKLALAVALVAALLVSACSGGPKAAKAPGYVEKTDTYILVDHKTKAVGQDVPDWVTLYISDGLHGVEAMDQFKDKYVFIGEDTGTNLNALRQWATGFTVAQELSRMVSTRVQEKFAGAAAGSPDDAFGRYFENVVKTVSESQFSGARKENDFWLLKRYYQADSKKVDREAYEYYVLVTIDRETLERQISGVLESAEQDPAQTSEQQTAIQRVKEAFYEGF